MALTLAASPAAAQKVTETVDRTIALGAGGRLKLENFSGDVRITGTSGQNVVVHAVRKATRERLDHIKLSIELDGTTLRIEANKRDDNWEEKNNNVVETEFDIQVPANTALDLNAFSSKIDVRGVTGEIDAHTFSGDIDLDVSSARETPQINAETFSGNIKTRLPASGNGRIDFNTFSGDLRSDLPMMLREGSKRHMRAEIGSGGPQLDYKTFSGDCTIVK